MDCCINYTKHDTKDTLDLQIGNVACDVLSKVTDHGQSQAAGLMPTVGSRAQNPGGG
jgi:hypothetical protein